MKTAATISEKLTARIEGKKEERLQILSECKREKEKTTAEIEALKAQQEQTESPATFRDLSKQISEKTEYLEFLEKKIKQTNERPAISRDEYGEIDIELTEENRRLTDSAAPAIIKKYDELCQLMEDYCGKANELQRVLNAAQRAHYGRTAGGHYWHALEHKRPESTSFFGRFCREFFNHYGRKAPY